MALLLRSSEDSNVRFRIATFASEEEFAVVQELGEREDAQVAAWGLSFGDQAHVVSPDSGSVISLRSPERALQLFRRGGRVTTRLVWVEPAAAVATE